MTPPQVVQATLAFRRYCFSVSRSVFRQDGKRGALLRVLAELPTFYT